MTPKSTRQWGKLKKLAMSLELPGITEATSWGQPCLKAHGKLWVWWSPSEDAPVFKVPFEERDMLVEAEPETFFFTPHYRNYAMVLARPERLDLKWARANLLRNWRDMAPKRVLKDYDAKEQSRRRNE
ncbi:MAG: MmcQ/YjbR family DNA-binding protein [Amphiplicatus sp.]